MLASQPLAEKKSESFRFFVQKPKFVFAPHIFEQAALAWKGRFPELWTNIDNSGIGKKKEIKFLCHAISSTAIFFILLITIIELPGKQLGYTTIEIG